MLKLLLKSIANRLILLKRLGVTTLLLKLRKGSAVKKLKMASISITSEDFIVYNAKSLETLMQNIGIPIVGLGRVENDSSERFFISEKERRLLITRLNNDKNQSVKVRFHFKESLFNKSIINTNSSWFWLNDITKGDLKRVLKKCTMLSFCFVQAKAKGRVVLGEKYAAQLEIWNKQDSFAENKRSYNNDIAISISDLDYEHIINDTIELKKDLLLHRDETKNIFSVKGPIDLVYTWVNDQDENWLTEKEKYQEKFGDDSCTSTSNSRFTNRDELKYSLRSVELYANFFNHIYIVTADQVPEWLNTNHPKITMVSHKDIFENKDHLPTFNSHAIEANLHRIEGLSEKFVYINDDVFFGTHAYPELFFTGNNKSKMFLSPFTYIPLYYEGKELLPIDASAINIQNIFKKNYNLAIYNKFFHVPFPILKSVMKKMSEEYRGEFESTSKTKFRGPEDISTTSFMYHYYAYLNGDAVEGVLPSEYFDINKIEHLKKLSEYIKLNEDKRKVAFCINETHIEHDMNIDDKVAGFLNKYFPFKSSFEK